ncbi:MAG: TerC family protein [Chlorobia bacterium]|nr:TerC family protein [Fimbriimonadaceae bacterium]
MFGQTFQLSDLAGVGALVVLEALLSADNALVLAIMVRHLPKDQQRKALMYGLVGAFVFRLLAILFAAVVLKQWWLQGVGALYLLWVPLKHFYKHSQEKKVKPVGAGFWQTVIAVELTDIAFAVDSILAGVTFIDNKQDKIWVVYFGAIIGIVLLRFAASMFIRLLEKYPALDHVAYVLVGWVGVKLLFLTGSTFEKYHPNQLAFEVPHMPTLIFWGVLLAIASLGTVYAVRKGRHEAHIPEDTDERFDEAMDSDESKQPPDVS